MCAGPGAAQQPPPHPIDWDSLGNETVRTLSQYLAVNTTNPPGNGMRAIQFLKRILEHEGFEVQVLDTESTALGPTRGNLYARLRGTGAKKATALVSHLDVAAAVRDPRARAWLTSDVYRNVILRNTISLTVLHASNKTNVIPAEASADLDFRLLPDADPAAVLDTLQRVVDDTAVVWTPLATPAPALESPIDTDLFHAIERAARERLPGVPVTTPMLTGGTDRPIYRALGIVTYGFDPFLAEASDVQKGVHGNDERVSVQNVKFGVRCLYDVLRYAQ